MRRTVGTKQLFLIVQGELPDQGIIFNAWTFSPVCVCVNNSVLNDGFYSRIKFLPLISGRSNAFFDSSVTQRVYKSDF